MGKSYDLENKSISELTNLHVPSSASCEKIVSGLSSVWRVLCMYVIINVDSIAKYLLVREDVT
jgi:hypothetical protein